MDKHIETTTIANGKSHHWLDRFFTNFGGRIREHPGSGIRELDGEVLVYGGTAFRFAARFCFATREEAEAALTARA